jgi:hypothetical protein
MTPRIARPLAATIGLLGLLLAGCGRTTTPTSASDVTSPVSVLWTSAVGAGGQASRSFTAAQAGTVTVSLTGVDLADGQLLGLGIGSPHVNGSSCYLYSVAMVAAGSGGSISAPVDQGTYCAAVFDPGSIRTAQAGFSVTIVYP